MSSSIHLAFDLYGTLLDPTSVSTELSKHLPRSIDADAVTAEWRKLQLEYTWRLNSMDAYDSFDVVTRKSLQHAVKEFGCDLSDETIEEMIRSYDKLNVFEDVPEALGRLKAMQNVSTLVFSNGTSKMVGNSINNSPELKHFSDLVLPFVVMDEIKCYKPARKAYHHLARRVGKEHRLEQVWLISGNPFDIVGARQAGLNAIWVDRKGKEWSDQLGEPTKIVKNLREVADILANVQV